jgi:hypothetical protein
MAASSVVRALETSPVRVSEGSAEGVRATRLDRASRCAMRDSLLRANCEVPIFAQVARYSRTSSTERRAPQDETGVHRGYCVGSTRHGLQLTSITASASCIAGRLTSAAVVISTVRSPAANALARERFDHIDMSFPRARLAARALLRTATARHAHDEDGPAAPAPPTPGPVADIAVKNLRFIGLPVLLLNFREVSRFHFCSTSVAV